MSACLLTDKKKMSVETCYTLKINMVTGGLLFSNYETMCLQLACLLRHASLRSSVSLAWCGVANLANIVKTAFGLSCESV